MLINFSVANWQSFRDKVTLSMVASREKQHLERVADTGKSKLRILPTAAIYGANASGKTKLFNAMAFAQRFVTRITQPDSLISREYFKLDKQYTEQPSYFSFELLIDEISYEFNFSITNKHIVEEKLIKVLGSTDKVLYHRINGKIELSKEYKENQRLVFVAEGTRDNQLFLTNSVDQKLTEFQAIYDWFKYKLILLGPQTSHRGVFDMDFMSDVLAKLDTGIYKVERKDVPIENLQLPEEFKLRLFEELSENDSAKIGGFNGEIEISKKNGMLAAKKLGFFHKTSEGKDVEFEKRDESAGTLRIMDLAPVFQKLLDLKTDATYFIDEIDRCFHTLVTRSFIETYLNSCTPQTRSQLIFTTHDVLLMDQHLLRRDEIWVTEKDEQGCSTLFSFGDYKDIRYDKDIRKSYLQGRLGGIPKILLWGSEVKNFNKS